MNSIPLTFDVETTDPDAKLGLRVKINNTVVYDNPHVTELCHVSQEIDDDEGNHMLEFELFGKLPEHTKIDESGEILQDAMLKISNIQFDNISVEQIISPEYHHDFNGTQSPLVDEFFGSMGCNGTVRLQFSTPIYLWLLENM